MIHLILGGARSGKSAYAETLAKQSTKKVTYIATAAIHDKEMQQRVEHHISSRPLHWDTIEETLKLAEQIDRFGSNDIIIIDCLTLWVTNILCEPEGADNFSLYKEALLNALATTSATVLLVSNETGMGIVPMGELSRRFCDESGRLHQDIATLSQKVTLMIAGIPTVIKEVSFDVPNAQELDDYTPCKNWLNDSIKEPSAACRSTAIARQNRLTKPQGSLGGFEEIAVQLASLQATSTPKADSIAIHIFAADHGIAQEGVSAFPQAVTVEMIKNFLRGGAAISVAAQSLGADLSVWNLGTVVPLSLDDLTLTHAHHLKSRAIAKGTSNFAQKAAMEYEQLNQAMAVGAEAVDASLSADLLIAGEMGIGNTTSAAAIGAVLSDRPANEWVGAGTGLNTEGIKHKANVIESAIERHHLDNPTPLEILRYFGGFEIAAMVGFYLRAAQRGKPVIVDGFICSVAAWVAVAIRPEARAWMIFSHHSAEAGFKTLKKELNIEPILDMKMRLGEGSGAASVVPLIRLACDWHNRMATFDEAGVSDGS
jgi:nicotinate-nucleotide--dimethylbenzimidazole phosphoribosyltransferase